MIEEVDKMISWLEQHNFDALEDAFNGQKYLQERDSVLERNSLFKEREEILKEANKYIPLDKEVDQLARQIEEEGLTRRNNRPILEQATKGRQSKRKAISTDYSQALR